MNQSESTSETLIASGRVLFSQQGFDGASVRAITRHAGANLGAITYHFGSKRGLYEAVLESELGQVRDAVLAVAHREGPAIDRMSAVVEAYFHVLGEHPDLPRLMLQELTAGRGPPEPVVRIFQAIAGALAALQIEGELDGSVRPGNPMLTAFSLVAQPVYMTLVSPMVQAVLGIPTTDPEFREQMIRHATEFARAGLAPVPDEEPK